MELYEFSNMAFVLSSSFLPILCRKEVVHFVLMPREEGGHLYSQKFNLQLL